MRRTPGSAPALRSRSRLEGPREGDRRQGERQTSRKGERRQTGGRAIRGRGSALHEQGVPRLAETVSSMNGATRPRNPISQGDRYAATPTALEASNAQRAGRAGHTHMQLDRRSTATAGNRLCGSPRERRPACAVSCGNLDLERSGAARLAGDATCSRKPATRSPRFTPFEQAVDAVTTERARA